MTKWSIQKPTKTNHSVPEKKASQVVGRTDKRHQFKGPLPAVQGIQKTKQNNNNNNKKQDTKRKNVRDIITGPPVSSFICQVKLIICYIVFD